MLRLLPFIVLLSGVIYLVLHYAGVFENISRKSGGSRLGSERSRLKPTKRVEQEIERRLGVFEEFLRRQDPPEDQS